jgi:adenylate kinase
MEKNPFIIILLGKSGSGKGTQAELLQKKFNLDYIGSGDLLRARSRQKDFTGKKLADTLLKGNLVPTPIVLKLWLDQVEKIKNKKEVSGFVMDGNPRKIMEAYFIDEALNWYNWDKSVKIFEIYISNKEAIWRLTKRRICKKCKEIIPFVGSFKNINECPKCGGELKQRNDDTVQSAKKRLSWYREEVQPIINYYKKTGRLIKINGEQSIEDVFTDILKYLK